MGRPERKLRSDAPSPNAYDPEKSVKVLDNKPDISFGLKPDDLAKFNTPSPSHYRPEDCKDEPKAPSLHIKPKDPKPFVTPSPGAYNPVKKRKHTQLCVWNQVLSLCW